MNQFVPRETPLGLRRTRPRTVITCPCGAVTDQGRRGLCPKCALRKCRRAEVGAGCEACPEVDRRVLCRRVLEGQPVTLCGSCAVLLGRRTLTLDELRAERQARAA